MYKLYEKVPKNEEYKHGMKMLEDDENPFKQGPCLLSMIAITMWERDVNGALNLGMEALRLKTTHNENTGIKLEDFAGRILSVAYGEPGEYTEVKGRKMKKTLARTDDLDTEFTEKYLFPLIEEEGKKLDTLQAMKNLRNVNIMTYCGATKSALKMEECLIERMQELGYNKEEIDEVLSQMCVVGYGTDEMLILEIDEKKEIKSTHFSFGDVHDPDAGVGGELREEVEKNNIIYFEEGYYFNAGTGEHLSKYYIIQNEALSLGISSVLTRTMSNSILNHKKNQFVPLSIEEINNGIEEIVEGLSQERRKEDLAPIIDSNIEYGHKKTNKEITEQDIGKATISVPTSKKDEARKRQQKDIEQAMIER